MVVLILVVAGVKESFNFDDVVRLIARVPAFSTAYGVTTRSPDEILPPGELKRTALKLMFGETEDPGELLRKTSASLRKARLASKRSSIARMKKFAVPPSSSSSNVD